MKFFASSLTVIVVLSLTSTAQAVADCLSFQSGCACPSNKPANSTCEDFSANCACFGIANSAGGEQFCAEQKTNCMNFVCAGAKLSSFSCDKATFSSQCLCISESNQQGGPMVGKNETACSEVVQQCAQQKCQGKKVIKNECQDPATAICQCEGDTPESNRNKKSPQPPAGSTNQAAFMADPSSFMHLLTAATFALVFQL